MINKKITLLLCALLLLSSCASDNDPADKEESSESTAIVTDETDLTDVSVSESETETEVSISETSVSSASRKTSADKNTDVDISAMEEDIVYLNDTALSKEDSQKIRELILKLSKEEEAEIISPDPVKTYYTIKSKSDSLFVQKCTGRYERYLMINDSFYRCNEEIDALVSSLLPENDTNVHLSANHINGTPEDRMYSYTLECKEPHEDEEYIVIGEKLAKMWLDSLADEEGSYHLGSYKMQSGELWGKGIVGGGREFCVECWFDVSDTGEKSVFCEPEDSGYNTFYHYYHGPGMYIRCRWENGVARIVDHTGVFLADLTNDLNGISEDNTSGYDTFFDFYNDKKAVQKINEQIPCRRVNLVAQSPILLADGRFSGVAIYPREYEYTTEQDGKLLGVFDNAYYNEEGETYSSPVDYKDGSGACTELYSKHFELFFDDYNCDGNPEFALKQDYCDEDGKGARYEVRCMSNDQTPRDTRFDFYMAGRTDECIRLQHIDGRAGESGLLRWSYDENGKMIPSVEVDDYRMYSQRYYLPPSLRGYDDEKQIICYFWNNTDKAVTTGISYTVEDKEGQILSRGKINSPTKADPYRETEVVFDVDTSRLSPGEYRIGLECAGSKIYGGFYIKGQGTSLDIRCADKKPVSGTYCLEYAITNNGTDSVRISSAALMLGEKAVAYTVAPLDGVLPAGSAQSIIFVSDEPLSAGDYHAEIDCGQIISGGNISLKEGTDADRYIFGGKAEAKLEGDIITVTVTVANAPEEPMNIEYIEIKTEDGWQKTVYTPEDFGREFTSGKNEIRFVNEMSQTDKEQLKELYDSSIEYIEKAIAEGEADDEIIGIYETIKDMDIRDFGYYIIYGYVPAELESGMKCRLMIGDEYVYFKLS